MNWVQCFSQKRKETRQSAVFLSRRNATGGVKNNIKYSRIRLFVEACPGQNIFCNYIRQFQPGGHCRYTRLWRALNGRWPFTFSGNRVELRGFQRLLINGLRQTAHYFSVLRGYKILW